MGIKEKIHELGDLQEQLSLANQKVAHLSGLVEFGKIINSTLDFDELLTTVMEIIKQVINAESASLMLLDNEGDELTFRVALGKKGKQLKEQFSLKPGQGIAGWVAEHGTPLIVPDVRKDKRFFRGPDKALCHTTRSILCAPLKAQGKTLGVIEAINSRSPGGFSEDDLDLLLAFAGQAAVAIESARVHARLLRRERVVQELKIAHQIQKNFLPPSFPEIGGARFCARTLPAWETGGDFYDFVDAGNNRIGVIIGDVSGKGVPAALYMVKILSEFRFHATSTPSVGRLLHALNESLFTRATSGMFVTLVYAILDPVERTLAYASAGHHPVIWKRANTGKTALLKDATGVPLGVTPGEHYRVRTIDLSRGDLLFFYTDGIIEARSRSHRHFGMRRLRKLVSETSGAAEAVVKNVIGTVGSLSREVPQHDDLTCMAIEIT